jgi:hypothetical protein
MAKVTYEKVTYEKVTYEKEITALLVIDPYNDFISEGGKIWGRIGRTRNHPQADAAFL